MEDPAAQTSPAAAAELNARFGSLDETIRPRLTLLALFRGFVDADVLGTLCAAEWPPELLAGLTPDDWIPLLDAAAEVGLLRHVADGCYSLHPALPSLLLDPLHQALPGQQEWLDRAFAGVYGMYTQYLLQLSDTRPEMVASLLRAEEHNLQQALHLARRYEQWDDAEAVQEGLARIGSTSGPQ